MKIIVKPQTLGASLSIEDGVNQSSTIHEPKDWEYATFLWAAGATAGQVSVGGLDLFEDAPEKRFFEALQDYGCFMSIRAEFVKVSKNERKAFQFDLSQSPEVYLPLIVLASQANGTSVLSNINQISNQEKWTQHFQYLTNAGLKMTIQDQLLIIKGSQKLNIDAIAPSDDAALLLTMLLLILNGTTDVTIHNANIIVERFPEFLNHFNLLLKHKIHLH